MLKFVDDVKLKAGVWLRERKERAEEKKAASVDPVGVTIPLSLVRSAKLAAWMAYFSLVYFLWLYTLDIARDRAASLHLTHVGGWIGEIQFYFPYIVGFAVVAVGIPYVAKIAIPTFMSLNWRDNFWPKLWALFIAAAVSLVVIAGTFTVQGDTLMERDRDAAVAVEGVQQGRAAIEAQIQGITDDLRASTEGNSTQAQAARVGMLAGSVEAARAQWTNSYVLPAERSQDANLERIRRATGSAEAAAQAVARREALRQQLATSTTVASVQEHVVTERTGWIAETLGWLEGVRAILLSLVMDIVCLIMPWIALRLEQARNRQMMTGRDLHPSMVLENHSGEPSIVDLGPGEAARAVFASGGTREEAEEAAREAAKVGTKKRRYEDLAGQDITEFVDKGGKMVAMPKRDPSTGKFVGKVSVTGEAPKPDERGVEVDGGNRTGSIAESINDLGMISTAAEGVVERGQQQATGDEEDNNDGNRNAEPEIGDEVVAIPESGVAPSFTANDQPDLPEVTPDLEAFLNAPAEQEQQEREPETDPAKLIAAE